MEGGDSVNDIITNTVMELGLNIAASAIWDVIKQYFNLTHVPTQEGIVLLLANKFGSQISTDQAKILAHRIFEAKVSNGAQIRLGEGIYQGGGSSIAVGKGAGIVISGDASIKAT